MSKQSSLSPLLSRHTVPRTPVPEPERQRTPQATPHARLQHPRTPSTPLNQVCAKIMCLCTPVLLCTRPGELVASSPTAWDFFSCHSRGVQAKIPLKLMRTPCFATLPACCAACTTSLCKHMSAVSMQIHRVRAQQEPAGALAAAAAQPRHHRALHHSRVNTAPQLGHRCTTDGPPPPRCHTTAAPPPPQGRVSSVLGPRVSPCPNGSQPEVGSYPPFGRDMMQVLGHPPTCLLEGRATPIARHLDRGHSRATAASQPPPRLSHAIAKFQTTHSHNTALPPQRPHRSASAAPPQYHRGPTTDTPPPRHRRASTALPPCKGRTSTAPPPSVTAAPLGATPPPHRRRDSVMPPPRYHRAFAKPSPRRSRAAAKLHNRRVRTASPQCHCRRSGNGFRPKGGRVPNHYCYGSSEPPIT